MDSNREESTNFRDRKSGGIKTVCEIVGQSRVLIENHYGILSYGRCCIHVRTEYGSMHILGDNLTFDYMSRSRLLIRGNVFDIKLVERGC